MINLYKLLYKLKNCKKDTICKCQENILEYNTKYQNQLDKFIIDKKLFQNRHHKYIYKIENILIYYYKKLEISEKQLLKISINISTEIYTVFNDLLELGKKLIVE